MTITIGATEIAAITDRVRIPRTQITPRTTVIAPLRGAAAFPRPRGAAILRWTIEVTRLHANRAAAESYLGDLESTVAALSAHSDTPPSITIGGRGTYLSAVVEDCTAEDLGLTTRATWVVSAAAEQAPPP